MSEQHPSELPPVVAENLYRAVADWLKQRQARRRARRAARLKKGGGK